MGPVGRAAGRFVRGRPEWLFALPPVQHLVDRLFNRESELSSEQGVFGGFRGQRCGTSPARRAPQIGAKTVECSRNSFEINCLWRRSARRRSAGGQEHLERASGKITVPMSRPSATSPAGGETVCWSATSAVRTAGNADTRGVHAGLLGPDGVVTSSRRPARTGRRPNARGRRAASSAMAASCAASASASPARGQRRDTVQAPSRGSGSPGLLATLAASVPFARGGGGHRCTDHGHGAVARRPPRTAPRSSPGRSWPRISGLRCGTGRPAGLNAASESTWRRGGRRRCGCGGLPRAPGRDPMPVRAFVTVAPSLRSSVAMAAMRSVSLTRQLAMLRRCWGRRRTAPSRPASWRRPECGCSPGRSPCSGQAPPRDSSQFGPLVTSAPICRAASTKRMSPWIEFRPTPSTDAGCPAAGAARAPAR